MAMTESLALVAEAEAASPGAVELACLLSLAARIEPELLRSVRLRLARHLPAAAEADLWFGPLVASRGENGISFHHGILPILRERLVRDDRWRDAWRMTRIAHRRVSPAIRLEEMATRAALFFPAKAGILLDNIFRPALVSLRQGDPGISAWAVRALPRLPPEASRSASAWVLADAANTARARSVELPGSPPAAYFRFNLDTLNPEDSVRLMVGRRGADLEIGRTHAARRYEIPVPDIDPLRLEIRCEGGQAERTVSLRADHAGFSRERVGRSALRVATPGGRVFALPALKERTILVAGSAGKRNLSVAEKHLCGELGKALARGGYRLLTGAWPGVDEAVGRAFTDELARLGDHPLDWIMHIVAKGADPKLWLGHPGWGAMQEPTRREVELALVETADAVILIGGQQHTERLGSLAMKLGKPCLPIPRTKGAAAELFARLDESPPNWRPLDRRVLRLLDGDLSSDAAAGAFAEDLILILDMLLEPEEHDAYRSITAGLLPRIMEAIEPFSGNAGEVFPGLDERTGHYIEGLIEAAAPELVRGADVGPVPGLLIDVLSFLARQDGSGAALSTAIRRYPEEAVRWLIRDYAMLTEFPGRWRFGSRVLSDILAKLAMALEEAQAWRIMAEALARQPTARLATLARIAHMATKRSSPEARLMAARLAELLEQRTSRRPETAPDAASRPLLVLHHREEDRALAVRIGKDLERHEIGVVTMTGEPPRTPVPGAVHTARLLPVSALEEAHGSDGILYVVRGLSPVNARGNNIIPLHLYRLDLPRLIGRLAPDVPRSPPVMGRAAGKSVGPRPTAAVALALAQTLDGRLAPLKRMRARGIALVGFYGYDRSALLDRLRAEGGVRQAFPGGILVLTSGIIDKLGFADALRRIADVSVPRRDKPEPSSRDIASWLPGSPTLILIDDVPTIGILDVLHAIIARGHTVLVGTEDESWPREAGFHIWHHPLRHVHVAADAASDIAEPIVQALRDRGIPVSAPDSYPSGGRIDRTTSQLIRQASVFAPVLTSGHGMPKGTLQTALNLFSKRRNAGDQRTDPAAPVTLLTFGALPDERLLSRRGIEILRADQPAFAAEVIARRFEEQTTSRRAEAEDFGQWIDVLIVMELPQSVRMWEASADAWTFEYQPPWATLEIATASGTQGAVRVGFLDGLADLQKVLQVFSPKMSIFAASVSDWHDNLIPGDVIVGTAVNSGAAWRYTHPYTAQIADRLLDWTGDIRSRSATLYPSRHTASRETVIRKADIQSRRRDGGKAKPLQPPNRDDLFHVEDAFDFARLCESDSVPWLIVADAPDGADEMRHADASDDHSLKFATISAALDLTAEPFHTPFA
ncbi:hypothetical protein ACHMW5_36105 (plasmid) [Azospirillum melinis]|uniref:hypothetical protein n=1 Tax=Azospirillum melinis TaxID=328839 RepID=UPI0037565F3E